MGIFDRAEERIERGVNGAFAKMFRSVVQPVEIASHVRRAMDDRAAISGPGRATVPNVFVIELSPNDYDRLAQDEDDVANEIIAAAQEHADSQHYDSAGRIRVDLVEAQDLPTGVFRVRSAKARRPDGTPAPKNVAPYADSHLGTQSAQAARAAAPPPPAPPRPASSPPGPPAPVAPLRDRPDRSHAHEGTEGTYAAEQAYDPPAKPRRVSAADRPWLDVDGERYPLMGALTVIGRDDVADVILEDPGISRQHSEIRVTQDGPHCVASIRDLGSTNGTYVNGERVTSSRLADQDRITIGRQTVTFRAGR